MIILAITIITLVIGVLIYEKFKDDLFSMSDCWGIMLIISGSIFLILEFAVILSKPFDYKSFLIKYETIQETITSSDDMRDATFTNNIIEINQEIKYAKEFRNNVWIGIFIPYEKGDLELLDKEVNE